MKERFKIWFFAKKITTRTVIAVTAIITVAVLLVTMGSVIIFRGLFINQAKENGQKDSKLVSEELDMFFSLVHSDSIYLGTCEWCQNVFKSYPDFESSYVNVDYKIYKAMQNAAYQNLVQKTQYHHVVLYDMNGNAYVSGDYAREDAYWESHQAAILDFMNSRLRDDYLSVHKSPWKPLRESEYINCISYIKKVFDMESGKLIGIMEFEIACATLTDLYRTVVGTQNTMMIMTPDGTVLSASAQDAAESVEQDRWFRQAKAADALKDGGMLMMDGSLYLIAMPDSVEYYVVNLVPRDVYMSKMPTYLGTIAIIALAVLAIGLYLSRILIHSIDKPLSIITQTIMEIGEGDFEKRVHVLDGGEIGILATQFNVMLDRLQNLMNRIMQTEQKKREVELSLVQMRMTPHFFYNVLESICGLIVIDNKRQAIKTINLLSNFYRGILSKGQEILTIERELKIAEYYIKIMQICYPDKFRYVVDCPENLLQKQINKLTLQPILENAVHHGFSQMETGGEIHVKIYPEGADILLDISDNGCGIEESLDEIFSEEKQRFHMESFGLRNTNERIQLFFGRQYGLRVLPCEQGCTIEIRLPNTDAAV